MADIKSYIVQYEILADVSKATQGLKELVGIAESLAAPMNQVKEAVTQVSQSLRALQSSSKLTFTPEISVSGFNQQLNKMVSDVEQAAAKMHAAIYNAMNGNAPGTKTTKQAAAKNFTRGLKDIEKEMLEARKMIEKYTGTPDHKGNGGFTPSSIIGQRKLLGDTKGAKEELRRLGTYKDTLKALKSEYAKAGGVYENFLREQNRLTTQAQTAVATTRSAKTAVKGSAVPNITPAAIREWQRVFGTAKSKAMTISIRGNASGPKGALTVITQINAALKELQAQATFNIKPILNPESFAAIEGKFAQLAALSREVAAPLGLNTGKGGKGAVIAKDKLPTLPVNIKIMASQVSESIKAIPRPVLPVNIKIAWGTGEMSRSSQLKKLTGKIPPVKLTLDISGALGQLNELVSAIRSKSPQTIAVGISGSAGGLAGQAVSGAAVAGNAAQAPATNKHVAQWHKYNAQQRLWRAQQQAQYDRAFGNFERAQIQRNAELAQMRADAQAVFGKGLTPYEKQLQAQQKATALQNTKAHLSRANQYKAQAWNKLAPFASNKEQLGILVKHRRFFRQAISATGIVPTATMEAPQMLQYLQGVSAQMQHASVPIPWQLQSQINALQSGISKAKGVSSSSARTSVRPVKAPTPVPFYDQARKWAYPFTGNTSFGARTPMAVDMAKGMGVMFAIGGAMSAVGSSFSQAMEYQNTMRTTRAILQNGTKNYTDTSFRGMEEIVRNVGVKTKFSAPEVASAARFLAMAGYDIPSINNAIRPIADLALIGDTDLGETADKMTNIMTTFGIPAEKMREAANIMTTTATRSNTDLMMLAESAKYGGGVANMYGRGDKNLFADTMALFGVMGNAGIQASSAGTALRMMYQNIFKPNKNQKAVLDMLDANYGIKTLKDDGGFRSMSDIIVDIAQKVPQDKLASIVGNLFRITAQPGASASIMAASNQAIMKAAEEDGSNAEEVAAGGRAIESFLEKNGLSKLVELMLANRDSINGNISENIALEKQNTIQGLWAQTTSTFTEGIVKAFEGREGYFAQLLNDLRDYLDKPETIKMIQNLLDMLISLGKTLAWFVKIWANLYNMFPNIIKGWIIAQSVLTQFGALLSPFVALTGTFTRLGGAIMTLSGASTVAATSISAQAAATRTAAGAGAVNMASIATGGRTWYGATKMAAYNAAAPASMIIGSGVGRFAGKGHTSGYLKRAPLYENAIVGAMMAQGYTGSAATNAEHRTLVAEKDNRIAVAMANKQRYLDRYAEVKARAQRIYGTRGRMSRAFNASAMINVASWAAMSTSIKQTFSGLMVGMAKAVGMLVNPISLAIYSLTGLGISIWKLNQKMKGETDGQKETRKKAEDAAKLSDKAQEQRFKSAQNLIDTYLPAPVRVTGSGSTVEKHGANPQQRYDRNSAYAEVFTSLLKNPSAQAIDETASRWKSRINKSSTNRLALGDLYDKYAGNALTMWKHYNTTYIGLGGAGEGLLSKVDNDNFIHTAELQERMAQAALMLEGANSKRVTDARDKIIQLRQQFLGKKITESEYTQQAKAIIQQVVNPMADGLLSADGITPAKLQNDTNWSKYQLYQQGGWNVLNAEMLGERGTITGYYNSVQKMNSGIKAYTDKWWDAISYITGNYRVNYDILVKGQSHTVSMLLSTLPNGRLDFSGILEQIRQKVAGFKLNLQTFSDMVATAYRIMAESGINVDTSYAGFIKFAGEQNQHQHITAETAGKYYDEVVARNPQWDGVSRDRYIKWITNSNHETIDVGGKQVSNAQERVSMRKSIAATAGIAQKRQYDEAMNRAKSIGGDNVAANNNNANGSDKGNGSGKGSNSGTEQDDYKSRYDRSSARPTQVIINVGNLANFDRTMIASSAEERDMISAMESRITEAVYRIFAEAANSANHVMDRV